MCHAGGLRSWDMGYPFATRVAVQLFFFEVLDSFLNLALDNILTPHLPPIGALVKLNRPRSSGALKERLGHPKRHFAEMMNLLVAVLVEVVGVLATAEQEMVNSQHLSSSQQANL